MDRCHNFDQDFCEDFSIFENYLIEIMRYKSSADVHSHIKYILS